MPHSQRSVVTDAAALDPRSRALLELQRESLARSLSENQPEPSVGDVWVTRTTWPTGISKGLAAMIVVLRAFTEAWSARTLYDVAPLSDDERLASEWSLLLGAEVSGLGIPIVAHVDAQCTTAVSMLSRRLGALAELALADLNLLVHAYASGDSAPLKLAVGCTGRSSIRHHLEWEDFASALLTISQALAAPLLDSSDGTPHDEAIAAGEPSLALVREPAPPRFVDRWAFELDPPRLVDRASGSDSVTRLGHVFARYLQDSTGYSLDREAFRRLHVLLDVEYEEMAALENVARMLRVKKCFGSSEPGTDVLVFVSRSLHHWQAHCAKADAGPRLDRLAARKADPRYS